MTQTLVDTSVVIDFLRQNNKKDTLLYKLASEENQLSISIITHTELYSGKSVWQSDKAIKELGKILDGLKVVPLSPEVSLLAGKIRTTEDVDLIDSIIASTAIINKMSLSTLNKRHFQNIPNLGLI